MYSQFYSSDNPISYSNTDLLTYTQYLSSVCYSIQNTLLLNQQKPGHSSELHCVQDIYINLSMELREQNHYMKTVHMYLNDT